MTDAVGFYARREVLDLTTLSNSSLKRKIAEGDFPRPVKLGARRVAWNRADVHDWMNQRTPDLEGCA